MARRRLGDELQRLRGRRTQVEACAALGWSRAKLAYIEAGERPLALDDLTTTVFNAYDVPPDERASLERLCHASNERSWWDDYGDEDLPPASKRFIGIEQGATRIRAFQLVLVYGLLQTAEYRTAILRHNLAPRPAEQLRVLIEVSRQRQEALTCPDPLDLTVILDEAALHRRVGHPEVMAGQLRHIADVAECHDNVTVQVIPFDAGPHPGLGGPFTIMEFGWPDDPGLVYLEPQSDQSTYLGSRRDVYAFAGAFERLAEIAESPGDSLQMLRRVADDSSEART